MKKITSILLAIIMVISLAACGGVNSGSLTASVLPSEDLDTLNKLFDAKFEFNGVQVIENVFAQHLENSKKEQFIAIVKIADDQCDAFETIDLWDEDSTQKYLELIGDNPVEDILIVSNFLPSKDQLALYNEKTIAEFEAEWTRVGPLIYNCAGVT